MRRRLSRKGEGEDVMMRERVVSGSWLKKMMKWVSGMNRRRNLYHKRSNERKWWEVITGREREGERDGRERIQWTTQHYSGNNLQSFTSVYPDESVLL